MENKSLSIIIPNYNGVKLIPKFMPSVIEAAESYTGEWEIIVVDDCSVDNSLRELRKFSQLKVHVHSKNKGFSGACNSGITLAKNGILFFLNTDVELSKDFFSHFSQHFENPGVFAITPLAYQFKSGSLLDGGKTGYWRRGNLRVTGNYYQDTIEKQKIPPPYPSFSVQGAYFFADAQKIRTLGGFDEMFNPFIFEETDLAYRALKRGWKIRFEPKCVARHDHSSTLNSVAKKRRQQRISERNRMLFTWKNIHSSRLIAEHWLFIVFRLLSFNFIYWQAFLDALKRLPEIAKKRAAEKQAAVCSDEEILQAFKDFVPT